MHGHDISNELMNRKTVNIPEPSHSKEIMVKHAACMLRHKAQQRRLARACDTQCKALEVALAASQGETITTGLDPATDIIMKMAILENKIEEATHQDSIKLPIKLNDLEQTHHYNEWQTF